MSTFVRGSLLALALVAPAAMAAPNAELARAEKAFEALKYTEAEKALQKALAVKGNDRATVLRIYELQGIIDATVGRKTALDHFRKLVAIDEERVLSRDLGPRVLAPFYEAKARLDENPAIKLKTSSAWSDGELMLHVSVSSDQLKLVQKIAVFWRLPEGAWTSRVEPMKTGVVDQSVRGDSAEWYVKLLGAHDAVLIEGGTEAAPLKAPSIVPQVAAVDEAGSPIPGVVAPVQRPMSTRRKIALATMGAGAVSLIGAGVTGLLSRSARSQFENPPRDAAGMPVGFTPQRITELQGQTVNNAVAANVLLGAGLVLAGTGAFLWIGDRDTSVALVPGPGSAVLAGTFP